MPLTTLRPLALLALLTACKGDAPKSAGPTPHSDNGDDAELDSDGDGFVDSEDCAPHDDRVFPGAEEVCDALDNNCDGTVDEGVESTFFLDMDGDGFAGEDNAIQACTAPEGFLPDATDCDDLDPGVHPDADEVCDGQDKARPSA